MERNGVSGGTLMQQAVHEREARKGIGHLLSFRSVGSRKTETWMAIVERRDA